MVRRTVTLNDFLHKQLQDLRGRLISEFGYNVGFTYILNTVILLGFCNPLSTEESVKALNEFTLENYLDLELANLEDLFIEFFRSREEK